MNNESRKLRILLIDDDAAVRQAITRVLEGADYEVMQAADGREAIVRFVPEAIDLLLLDLDMPGISGWDVFERLTTRYPLVPVIIITGLPNQRSTALAAGVGALLEKPLDIPVLLRTIEELLAEPPQKRLLRVSGYLGDLRHAPAVSERSNEH
jgi:two-component system, OmpR family, response regulator VicR